MIGIDSNILARFYCEDPDDPEAVRQRPKARKLILESNALFVPLSVVLEFEWVIRGFYRAPAAQFRMAIEHLRGMP